MSKTDTLKIAVAQLNPTVGDLAGNMALARQAVAEARSAGADLVVFSELFVTGYPPEDLALKPAFQTAARAAVEAFAKELKGDDPAVLLGSIWREDDSLYNSVVLVEDGRVAAVRHKVDLPNYGVFDEKRIFAAGPMPGPINFRGVRLGVPICEDIWGDEVTECLEETGAELLIVPNGSPYNIGKWDVRMNVAVARIAETGLPMLYVNQVGGQDELVFDGASFALNGDCSLAAQLPAWQSVVRIVEVRRESNGAGWVFSQGERALNEAGDPAIYQACVLGLRDYVEKNGFPRVVLGLSGGVDSALTAAIAVDALGPERVHCLMLPYRYTSDESLEDAAACAELLGVRYDSIAIKGPVEGFMEALGELFAGTNSGVTEENLQSRARGTLLMALSNKFGSMLVTTGNKSEVAVGYATLYGDMNGGFNPIKDLYKTKVYALSRYRNAKRPPNCLGRDGPVMPENIITKAPTAELKEGQTDQDSLPPYDALDDILECIIEEEKSLTEIVARGHAPDVVTRIARLVDIAEYKRRQAAPGVKISRRNFGRERRYPITNRFRDTP